MEYTITRVTEEPKITNGQPDADMAVEFTVGKDGPFFERFPKADFTPSTVQTKLQQRALDLKLMRGGA